MNRVTQRSAAHRKRLRRQAPVLLAAVLAVAWSTAASWGGPHRAPATAGGAPIVFIDAQADGSGDGLWRIQPDGQAREPLLSGAAGLALAGPEGSPDGRRIVFAASPPATPGAGRRSWSLKILAAELGTVVDLTEGPADLSPAWSPAGTPILFASYVGTVDQPMSSAFARINPDGSDPRLLIALDSPAHLLADPAWSPDGRLIALVVQSRSQGGELYRMTDTAEDVTRLFAHPGWDDVDPAWSPDGRRLAFASGLYDGSPADTRHDIWLLDLASGIAGTIVTDPVLDLRRPAWSADGCQIALDAAPGPAGRREIHLVPAAGGPPGRALTTGWAAAWAGDHSAPTAASPSPTPSATGSPTAVTATPTPSTPTPPVLPTLPPLPTLPVFPTPPPVEPTSTGPAPTFPPPLLSPTPRPTGALGFRCYLPSARNNDAPEPPPPGADSPRRR